MHGLSSDDCASPTQTNTHIPHRGRAPPRANVPVGSGKVNGSRTRIVDLRRDPRHILQKLHVFAAVALGRRCAGEHQKAQLAPRVEPSHGAKLLETFSVRAFPLARKEHQNGYSRPAPLLLPGKWTGAHAECLEQLRAVTRLDSRGELRLLVLTGAPPAERDSSEYVELLQDVAGVAPQIYDARPGTVYLARPDGH